MEAIISSNCMQITLSSDNIAAAANGSSVFISVDISVQKNCDETTFDYNIPITAGTFDANDYFTISGEDIIFDSTSLGLTVPETTDPEIIVDGIYTIQFTFNRAAGDPTIEQDCVFSDCCIRCKLANYLLLNNSDNELLLLYNGVKFNAECCYRCEAYTLYLDLDKKLTKINGNCGCC